MSGHFQGYETRRFRLRRVSSDDIESLFRNFSDPQLMQYYDMQPVRHADEVAELLLHWKAGEISGTGFRWGIADRISDRLLGTVGLHGINKVHRRCETGYEIDRDSWRCGVMSEVFPYVLRHAFNVLGLFRVGALVVPTNAASIALLEKFGFRREGTLRGYMKQDGMSADMASFGLLRSDTSRWIATRIDPHEERIRLTL